MVFRRLPLVSDSCPSTSPCVVKMTKPVVHLSHVALEAVRRLRLVRFQWATQDRTSGTTLSTPRRAPSGSMSNVEALCSSKLQAVFQSQKYESFIDFSAVSYTTSLDKYISAFQTDGVPQWHSLLVQLAALPAHFRTCLGRRPLWAVPWRTLCSACPPQFSLSTKSPNSRSTSSMFLWFQKMFQHLGRGWVLRGSDGRVGGPLPKHRET